MIITIKDTNHSASINNKGAELFEFTKDKTNYIWTIDEQFWNKTSPILFPIVGRLKNDSYTLNEKVYKLPRHGFARDCDFEVIHQKENEVVFSLRESQETLKMYPFEFELQIKYTLENNKLTISYKVINHSENSMPFNIGAHPAFAMNGNFEDYSLQFNKNEEFETHHLENELFNAKTDLVESDKGKIPLTYSLFEKDALVFKHLKSNELSILKENNPYLKINYEGFPFLGIWTKQNAPFLCVEPWYGHADEKTSNGNFHDKKAIQVLNSKASFIACFKIIIF
ncbi:aldose 1-epimerase family protein [uncultured Flavobacterium sp.]|uniref:aldose 1-epimerase family protein n=1 Tax=uncultured Flavobacterium sp. TaxID=165435 RepID=UPI0030EE3AF0|tara:strand:+ start:25679 stop:26527 length:849 start_codon:yes stop_codon:yes gene_type:complete